MTPPSAGHRPQAAGRRAGAAAPARPRAQPTTTPRRGPRGYGAAHRGPADLKEIACARPPCRRRQRAAAPAAGLNAPLPARYSYSRVSCAGRRPGRASRCTQRRRAGTSSRPCAGQQGAQPCPAHSLLAQSWPRPGPAGPVCPRRSASSSTKQWRPPGPPGREAYVLPPAAASSKQQPLPEPQHVARDSSSMRRRGLLAPPCQH